MKKTTPYFLLGLVVLAVITLVVTGSNKKKRLNERITLRKKDKIPYGTWVAFQSLPVFFPSASVYTSRQEPGYWDSVSANNKRQAFIAITPSFMADEFEMEKLIEFARNGNDVFISAAQISYDVKEMITAGDKKNLIRYGFWSIDFMEDTLELSLLEPEFSRFAYPGKNYSSSFEQLNQRTGRVLGKNASGYPNFIHLRAGKGNFYLHLAPLAFSNYFLLHKNNINYYEKVMSFINPATEKIVWDEYYLFKRSDKQRQKKKSWLTVLSQYPALKAALLTALATLAIFILLEMRRKQRYIPVIPRPKNDSLDFVKTIGRLYYDRGDHKNLCRKMSAWFLEHVRTRYKLATGILDDSFIKNLQFKTGVEIEEIKALVDFIRNLDSISTVSAADVTAFHRRLESFYKKA